LKGWSEMNEHSRFKMRFAGFSYIEMLVVVLLIAIFAAVATPRYVSAINRYRVDGAAQRVIADLQYARSEAQRNSQSRTVQFNSASNVYALVGMADRDHPDQNFTKVLSEEPYASRIISATFGGDEAVIFDMYGRPDSSGTLVLQSGSLQRTVSLAPDGTATKL